MEISQLMNFTVNDLCVVTKFIRLAEEATQASELISQTYKFDDNEEKRKIWHSGGNFEYLTREGVWQARYLHQNYDVPCTVDGIFELFKSEYFVNAGISVDEGTKLKAKMAESFRAFLAQTREASLANS